MGESDTIGTAGQIAAALRVTAQWVSGLGARGLVPVHGRTVGGRKLFQLAEVRAYRAAHPEPAEDAHLLTAHELGRLLRRPLATVGGWVTAGALPAAGRKRNADGRWVRAYRLDDARVLDARAPRTAPERRGLALPPAPTFTRPGSEERMRVYEARIDAGFAVFHPDDLKLTRGAA